MGITHATAYRRWLRMLAESDDVDFDPWLPDPELQTWLLDAFRGNGELPTAFLAPLVLTRRTSLVRSAVASLQRELQADGQPAADVVVAVYDPTEHHPMGKVSVEGQPVQALDLPGVLTETAEGFQCFVADPVRLVWPTCSLHRLGVHPRLVSGTASWTCSAGHVLRAIG